MSVGLVGSGPGRAAVEAALGDVGAEPVSIAPSELRGDLDLAVVVADSGAETLDRANERALDTDLPWLAVELGGVGGVPVTDAAVAGFGPGVGCYGCLSGRVKANLDGEESGTGAESATAPPAVARFAGAVAGRTAVAHLVGDRGVGGRLIELPYAERTFLPLPGCRCAGDRDRTLHLGDGDRGVEAALASAERALDDRVGLVTEVGEAESVPLPYYLARGSDTAGFSDATAGRDAAGVAAGWDAAFMKALGEALERYCAGVYRRSEFETGTAAAVDDAVDPSAILDVDPGAELGWVPGTALGTGERVALPAAAVHHPPPTGGLGPALTTGLALGNGGIDAVLGGLYEVIERDAAVLAWYSTFEPLGLAVDDPAFEALRDRARSADLSASALLVTQDIDVPVVAAAVTREEWPRLAFGLGADLDAAAAARSALAEALQNWMELRSMGPEGASEAAGEIGHYADRPPEAATLLDTGGTVPATSVGPETAPDGEAELAAVLDRLSAAELSAYAARTTTRDVDRLGFEAVRVLVPGAQPLFFDDPAFEERARTVPEQLGFEARPDRAHHPFP